MTYRFRELLYQYDCIPCCFSCEIDGQLHYGHWCNEIETKWGRRWNLLLTPITEIEYDDLKSGKQDIRSLFDNRKVRASRTFNPEEEFVEVEIMDEDWCGLPQYGVKLLKDSYDE